MTNSSQPSQPTFAQLLKHLMNQPLHPEGRPYTITEAAHALPGNASYQHLWRLLQGKIEEPTWPTIEALCRFFRVRPEYFFPGLQDVDFRDDIPPLD